MTVNQSFVVKMSKARDRLIKRGKVIEAREMIVEVFSNPKKISKIIKKYIDEKDN